LSNKHGEGVLTGKSLNFGGSPLRPEATGYGTVYMAKLAMEKKLNRSLDGMRCAVSGSGNVAQFAAEKLIEFNAKVITVSDSNGVLIFDDGMTTEDLEKIMECKNVQRDRLKSLDGKVKGRYVDGESPWSLEEKYDLALPCATQNEINGDSAKRLLKNGLIGVFEGANLPTNTEAQQIIRDKKDVIYVPGKASNAGGVGVSGLEMSQNAQRLTWTEEKIDDKLQTMMENIYTQMENAAGEDGTLEEGANRAGFIKVAEAMQELGWV